MKKNWWLVLFGFVHCLATFVVGAGYLFVGLLNLGAQPRPAELTHLEGAFRVMSFPALFFLFDVMKQGGDWLLWLVVPFNSILAALLVKLAWSVIARLHRPNPGRAS